MDADGRQQPSLSGDDRATQEERIDAWFDSIGLTAREREIGLLLAYGRTQPWIAERLSISENTVAPTCATSTRKRTCTIASNS